MASRHGFRAISPIFRKTVINVVGEPLHRAFWARSVERELRKSAVRRYRRVRAINGHAAIQKSGWIGVDPQKR